MKRTICWVIIGLALLSAVSQLDFAPLVQLIAFPLAISLFVVAPLFVLGVLGAPVLSPLGVWLYLRWRRGERVPGWLVRLVPARVRRVVRRRRRKPGEPAALLRVVVDEDPAVAPERAVRAGYLHSDELADVLGLDSGEAQEVIAALERGIPYSEPPGEYERIFVIPRAAVGLLDTEQAD
jgi:hypothetical protein